jgi:hypothetical protein
MIDEFDSIQRGETFKKVKRGKRIIFIIEVWVNNNLLLLPTNGISVFNGVEK